MSNLLAVVTLRVTVLCLYKNKSSQ